MFNDPFSITIPDTKHSFDETLISKVNTHVEDLVEYYKDRLDARYDLYQVRMITYN